ncbi:type IV secretory system conjugative DNA transfer family protein [Pseudonocardia hydrocarbonoxydans]|uniref:TraD/TraG TraM recognition site domain-containing protein n=1 Tax=Pseudonocardia hydrocarbonoxydans TaxID=76726 RepID=A0A4Y3WLC6_9PSEU|nr:TraM recognition domain-containing protein [Pseudonocardia hydrocarbonoxydans]GEC18699.1 hypothetical protein PHY01_09820 [Pseudonocardia hydrocarbonoxydans]
MNGSTLVILLALLAGSALAWRRGARAMATALILVAALPAVTLLKQTPAWAVVAVGVVLVGVLWHRHARTAATITRWSAISRRKAGVASTMDIARVASAPAMRRKAASVRPSLAQTTRRARWLQLLRLPAVEVAVRLCRVGAQSVWASVEDFIVVFGGPRTGKTQWLAGRIIDASGAVLVTSTRIDLLDITAPLRGSKGPVYVFNAVGMAGLASTITFDPLTGCTDPTTAAERAADMLGASRGGSGDREFWDAQGRRVLAALMHAAALGGLHMRDVLGWVADPDSAGRVESLLRRSPEDAFVQEARQFISTNDRTRSSITSTIMPALGWLTSSAAAAAAEGSTPFDVAELLASRATVYLLGAEETQAAPLVCALTGHVAREARRIAAGCPGGRLDPPLTLALDEAALISPVPLQSWSADMGGRGVTIISAFQSRAQLLARYGQHDAATTLNNAGSVMVFGGTRDRDDLNFWATLGGERDEPITTTDLHGRVASRTVRKVPVVAPAQIANLPAGRVVTFRRGMPPVVGTVDMAWRRRDVRALSRTGGRWERPRRAWAWLTRPPFSPAHEVAPIARDLPVWATARPDEGWRN